MLVVQQRVVHVFDEHFEPGNERRSGLCRGGFARRELRREHLDVGAAQYPFGGVHRIDGDEQVGRTVPDVVFLESRRNLHDEVGIAELHGIHRLFVALRDIPQPEVRRGIDRLDQVARHRAGVVVHHDGVDVLDIEGRGPRHEHHYHQGE